VTAVPTIHEALAEYLEAKGMPADSGRSQRWVAVRWLGLPIVFPNFDARRRVLFLHDVHHLLTGYPTTWTGEGEIGAFELRTGCGRLWAAWMFNGGGFLFGLAIAPRALFRAFVRARGCRNFYGTDERRVATLDLATARAELGLAKAPERATVGDRVQFAAWALGVVAVYVVLPAAALLAIWHSL
jgi:hypothetical protein